MFERCLFPLTIVTAGPSVRGTCLLFGNASSTRCKCLVSTTVRSARRPSDANSPSALGFLDVDVMGDEGDAAGEVVGGKAVKRGAAAE